LARAGLLEKLWSFQVKLINDVAAFRRAEFGQQEDSYLEEVARVHRMYEKEIAALKISI